MVPQSSREQQGPRKKFSAFDPICPFLIEFCFYEISHTIYFKRSFFYLIWALMQTLLLCLPHSYTSPSALLTGSSLGQQGPFPHPVRTLVRTSLTSFLSQPLWSSWFQNFSKTLPAKINHHLLSDKLWIFLVIFLLDFLVFSKSELKSVQLILEVFFFLGFWSTNLSCSPT